MPGRIVLLNGASSSGKSTIAREFLALMPTPWFHMAVDDFHAMRAYRRYAEGEMAPVVRRTRAGFHRAVAAMASVGNDVIADHVLSEPWRLEDCLDVFGDLPVVFVGVRCGNTELGRREQARRDRDPGTAAAQDAIVHAHGIYDLEVCTDRASPGECADAIKAFVESGLPPTAFDRLRAAT